MHGARHTLRPWLLSLVLWLIATVATATPRIVDQAWLDDPTGAWTLEDATQRTFTPYTGLLSRGYGPGAVWIRLRLDPGAEETTPSGRPDAPQRIVLRMSPS